MSIVARDVHMDDALFFGSLKFKPDRWLAAALDILRKRLVCRVNASAQGDASCQVTVEDVLSLTNSFAEAAITSTLAALLRPDGPRMSL